MPAIVASTEIDRPPDDVFGYAVDPAHLPAWQENVVSASHDGELGPGARVVTVRRLGSREQTRIEPLDGGSRSLVTIELDFEGHGVGKLLLPLLVRPEARKELPRNLELRRQRLEGS